jgi:hypothetical protein
VWTGEPLEKQMCALEKFDANVTIHSDASYVYSHVGIFVFAPALLQVGRMTS